MNGPRLGPGSASGAPFSANWMRKRNWSGRKPFWMAASFLRKEGDGVGKTKVGKGSKVMVVTEGNGLPIGLHVDSAQPHESTLAEVTLQTIRVPQQRGRPKTRPKSWSPTKPTIALTFVATCAGVASN